jgi:hypothetical protein
MIFRKTHEEKERVNQKSQKYRMNLNVLKPRPLENPFSRGLRKNHD